MIKRYDPVYSGDNLEEEEGDYVLYKDHNAEVAQLTSIISGLELDLKKAQELVARYRCMQDLWLSDD